MKWIIAIIQPHRLNAVRDSLTALDIHGMTVSEVKGYGRQRGQTEIYRGAEYKVDYIPKVKIELAVTSDKADTVIAAITEHARTERIGDGKIFVLDLAQAVRIRTGESDAEAL